MSQIKAIGIASITDKEVWERFIRSREEANFLQSWSWGSFHENLGKRVFRLGLTQDSDLVGCALAVKEEAKRGNYLAIYGGPILDWNNNEQLAALIQFIKAIGAEEKCQFVRIRPQIEDSPQYRKRLGLLDFRSAPMHLTADLTRQIFIENKSNEELLDGMRKSTRYEIRKANRLNIKVVKSKNPNDISNFHKQHLILAKKHKFVPFSYKFLQEQFKAFVADDQALLFHAHKDRKLLASAFVIFYNREAVYHYGISTEANARLPGSYAVQWEVILEAKRRGMERYNLWGVAEKDQPHHRFAGVSKFKRGFGGEEIQYLPSHDLPLDLRYAFTYVFESARKKLRRL